MHKALYKSAAPGSSASLAVLAGFSNSPAPKSPIGDRPSSPGWRYELNKKEGECRWPLPPPSKEMKDCDFVSTPAATMEDGTQIVTIPAGTVLYHATTIYPGKPQWFTQVPPFASIPLSIKAMWFASSADHATHMNYTHVLEYTLKKDVHVFFFQNITTTFGSVTGKYMLANPKFTGRFETAKDMGYDVKGYMGCNECEIAFLKQHLPELFTDSPKVVAERDVRFLSGGFRKAKQRKTLKKKHVSRQKK
jgi:hypothetical protein